MRIVLDLRIYGPKYGGLGRYNQQLLAGLVEDDQDNEYIVLVKGEHRDELPILPANFSATVCNCHWYSLKEQWQLPWLLRKLRPDLVHFPHFNIPYFYFGKFIVTIHDLIMTKYPSQRASTLNKFFFLFKRAAYALVISKAIRQAQAIITVSNFSAQDIKNYWQLSSQEANKIKVVYEGITVPDIYREIKQPLPEKFLLYVGNAYPHKNLEFLIRGFKEFNKQHPEYSLVLVGSKNYFYNRLEEYAVKLFGAGQKKIIFSGFVSDQDLSGYYQQATAYVFPSHYEGFGLPPLEAMAYGLPVLAARSSSLPEVLGSAALYFNPSSDNDLLASLELITKDNVLRERLRQLGLEQIKLYSWKRMAKEIISIYDSLLKR